jgi:hypothetical protein
MNFGWHPKNKSGDYIALFVSLGGGFGPCSGVPKASAKTEQRAILFYSGSAEQHSSNDINSPK